jgi:hypothetical protein
MSEHLISADENGNLQFIYSDEIAFLSDLGQTETHRVSDVEPDGEGGWVADMARVSGPKLGPFNLRGDALTAETDYIKENVL